MNRLSQGVVAAAAVAGLAGSALAQLYDFTINSTSSGLSGTIGMSADTTGTLIGNWDEVSNPTGTRTKPGLFGTFDPTENLPVPVDMGLNASGPINSRTSGMFRLGLNPGAGTLLMENFASNFLASGPVQLPITMDLLFSSFRTRQPTSTYVGGIPLSVPIGEATLTQLTAQQVGSGVGVLTPTGPGTYDFAISPVVLLTAEFSVLGNPMSIPGLPVALPLGGQITVSGTSATLSSIQPLEFANGFQPNLQLPQFPLDLPTILPPGEVAHLLMDLLLTDISNSFEGALTIHATGTLVPAPSAAIALAAAGIWNMRRRRRGTMAPLWRA